MTNQIPLAIVDCDGVIFNFTGGFQKYMDVHHSDIKIDPSSWDYGMGDKAWSLIIEFWDSPEFASGLDFYPGAKAGINELAKIFELHVVSALDPNLKKIRAKNLTGVNYRSLTLISKKLPYILSKKPMIAIEDKPEYVLKMVAVGIDVYYPIIPLTTSLQDSRATPYKTWKQLVNIIKKKYA